MATLYHNPRCSKSRQTLAIIEASGVDFSIVEYLRNPLTTEELLVLLSRLQGNCADLVRFTDSEFAESGYSKVDLEDAAVVAELLEIHPSLMQRPIYDDGKSAVIGRPPEAVNVLLRSGS